MNRHSRRERSYWRAQIHEYLEDELEPTERLALERELARCDECRAFLDEHQRLLRLRLRGKPPNARPPADIRSGVLTGVERRKRAWALAGWPVPSPSSIVLSVTILLLAFLVPSLFQVLERTQSDQRAAPASLVSPTSTHSALPTMAVVFATVPPETPASSPIPLAQVPVTTLPTPVPPSAQPSATALLHQPAAPQPQAAAPLATPTTVASTETVPTATAVEPTATSVAGTATAVASPEPTATLPTVRQMAVSGRVTEVDRGRRVVTVQEGTTTVVVAFAADTTVESFPGGGWLGFGQVGIADQVEVTGVVGNTPDTILALRVRVLGPLVQPQPSVEPTAVPSAAPASSDGPSQVLYLQDGAERRQADDWSYTRSWPAHLARAGINVVTADPARLGALTLDDIGLVVIGYPATLNPATLRSISEGRVPVLLGNPLYIQALQLGEHPDETNPLRTVLGTSVRLARGPALVEGLTGVQPVARTPIRMVPIVPQGVVLASLTDGGRESGIWTIKGSRVYLGLWADADGRSLLAPYWSILERSVTHLLGSE